MGRWWCQFVSTTSNTSEAIAVGRRGRSSTKEFMIYAAAAAKVRSVSLLSPRIVAASTRLHATAAAALMESGDLIAAVIYLH